ncbi:hypothetical protein [Granulicella sp. S156]|uniref:beta strand repeat-containing protein n=1 Tax=Granulicella sp. S156 TaxID=1747224 RepID=UPI0020B15C36|nr:hypothetical protein [Granulicella sp. S156]
MTAGCGSASTSKATAGPIATSTSSGTAVKTSVLAVGSSVNFSMMPVGDKSSAGVDWTVTCEGNPVTGSIVNGACGTLAPAHTSDGAPTVYTAPSVAPIGGAITVTATVTSNPAQSSSESLTIVASPIGVAFTTAVPSSLQINVPVILNVAVTNDPLAAGVIWTATCGATGACGSFNLPQGLSTTYTAPSVVPAGGTVTITATSLTDTTKFASAKVTITAPPPPVPVTVSVLPSSVYVTSTSGPAHSTSLTAIVGNDPAAAGVDWSLSCGASTCGTLNASVKAHTASGVSVSYAGPSTVPPGGTVTITATSTTNPAISASATATVLTTAPIVVTMSSAPPAALTAGTQATLAATVAADPNSLGVNWTASCGGTGGCGSFNLSPAHTASAGKIVYTAPASVPTGGLVTITASSPASTPSNSAIAVITVVVAPPSLTFKQAPPAMMTAVTQAPISATVTNDVAPGGVNWSVQCSSTVPGGCGWIGPVQTASGATAVYTAPPVTSAGTTVTVTATSVANPSVSISSSAIAISPSTVLSVGFIPSLPAQIQTNATVNLTAAVANDTTNAGVDWQVCASGCGFFTVKPAIPAIPATTTTPYVPAVPAVTAPTVSGWSNGLPIPYTAPSEPPTSGVVVVEALSHADGTTANSGTIAVTTSLTGPALSGEVQAGTQPVVGASVFLYAAGTSGYASASSKIATTTTDKNGNFTVPAGYTCPSSTSEMYVVATGGKVGTNAANPNLSMMTALGSCNGLGSSAVVVNEVTTVASAWATAPFAANDALTGNGSSLYLGTSSGNLSGLANAFAAVNNLVDITTGQARFVTPVTNAAVPYVEIDTLADFLNACTATSGGVEGDGSPCGVLFAATDTLGTGTFSGSIAPSDTLQAAFNIAQQPVTNFGYTLNSTDLISLATSSAPFQPILTALPNDWSISLNYTGGGGLTTASTVGSFAVDASGNLWITDTTAGDVIEWNAAGAALSPSSGFPAGGGLVAIDANGNAWVSGNGVLSELTNLGTPVLGSPFAGVAGGGSDMTFDAQDNLWIANGVGVNEFNNLGVELSPASGFTNTGISGITAVGVDSSNNVWIGNLNIAAPAQASFSELTNPGGELITDSANSGGVGIPGTVLPGLAADGAGDIWGITTDDEVCKAPPYGGKGLSLILNCLTAANTANAGGGYLFLNANGLALDGAGTLWVSSVGGPATGGGPAVLPSILPFSASVASSQNFLSSPSLAAGPLRVAVDGSGNVWVLLANNTVTEYVGVATPVVTPIALGVKNKKLAAKP